MPTEANSAAGFGGCIPSNIQGVQWALLHSWPVRRWWFCTVLTAYVRMTFKFIRFVVWANDEYMLCDSSDMNMVEKTRRMKMKIWHRQHQVLRVHNCCAIVYRVFGLLVNENTNNTALVRMQLHTHRHTLCDISKDICHIWLAIMCVFVYSDSCTELGFVFSLFWDRKKTFMNVFIGVITLNIDNISLYMIFEYG